MITEMNVQVCETGHKFNYIEPGKIVLSKINRFGGMWPCELYAATECGKLVYARYRSFVLTVYIATAADFDDLLHDEENLVYRAFADSDDEEAEDYDGTSIDLSWLLYWTGIELTDELREKVTEFDD